MSQPSIPENIHRDIIKLSEKISESTAELSTRIKGVEEKLTNVYEKIDSTNKNLDTHERRTEELCDQIQKIDTTLKPIKEDYNRREIIKEYEQEGEEQRSKAMQRFIRYGRVIGFVIAIPSMLYGLYTALTGLMGLF